MVVMRDELTVLDKQLTIRKPRQRFIMGNNHKSLLQLFFEFLKELMQFECMSRI